MKKYKNTAIVYAVMAMCAGVFYREFTKTLDFKGQTMLGYAHPHLFWSGNMYVPDRSAVCARTDNSSREALQKIFHSL